MMQRKAATLVPFETLVGSETQPSRIPFLSIQYAAAESAANATSRLAWTQGLSLTAPVVVIALCSLICLKL
jgi:hypothetical protein